MDYWKDEGGNAFPADETANQNDTMGMSLRDYFAGQAMIGIMSTSGAFDRADRRLDMVANKSYELADAMIEARGGGVQ